jgi:hypothetical protein
VDADAGATEPALEASGSDESMEAQEGEGESVKADSIASESDTMEDSHSSAQSPEEKGEVHES